MQYRNYDNNDIIEAVKNSRSIAEVLKTLGLKPMGGNYGTVHRKITILSLDTSHFTGQLWSKDKQIKEFVNLKSKGRVKVNLIKVRGHRCELCNLTIWNELPIPLEVHHKDGFSYNNQEDNLTLLCPNCHSQTDNFRKRKLA